MQRLGELYENEKKYVEKLSLAKRYGDFMERSKTEPDLLQMPEDFVETQQIIFLSLDQVLTFHQNYILPEIEIMQKNPKDLLSLFKSRKGQFKTLYGKFCCLRIRYFETMLNFRAYLYVRTVQSLINSNTPS